MTFTQNLLNLELCIIFLTPYLFCCFCYQYCFKYWNFTLLTHLFLQKHQMNASVVENGESTEANEELETTYKLNSKGQACLLFQFMAFQAFFCKYLLFIYLHVLFLLNGDPFMWSLCFSCFCGPLPPFFSPLALFAKLSWLLRDHPWRLPGKSPSLQELPTLCYFLNVTYLLSQNFSAWLSLLLSNQCPAWRKSFSHQVELGQLTGWVSPAKFFPTQ